MTEDQLEQKVEDLEAALDAAIAPPVTTEEALEIASQLESYCATTVNGLRDDLVRRANRIPKAGP